ncbi:hypothetical protein AAMO2058_001229700 [Amorphochlora amoebiformis]
MRSRVQDMYLGRLPPSQSHQIASQPFTKINLASRCIPQHGLGEICDGKFLEISCRGGRATVAEDGGKRDKVVQEGPMTDAEGLGREKVSLGDRAKGLVVIKGKAPVCKKGEAKTDKGGEERKKDEKSDISIGKGEENSRKREEVEAKNHLDYISTAISTFEFAVSTSLRTLTLPPAPHFNALDHTKVMRQRNLGGQTVRGATKSDFDQWKKELCAHNAIQKAINPLLTNPEVKDHMRLCFKSMLDNEQNLCENYAVFYHSFSFAEGLYQVYSALANVLFGYEPTNPIPRLELFPFLIVPNARVLRHKHEKEWKTDHHKNFRDVGVCAVSSLLTKDREATPYQVWEQGYHVSPIHGYMDRFLNSVGLGSIPKLAFLKQKSLSPKPLKGRLMQIFIRRELVEDYVYPSHPMGKPDDSRDPLSTHLSKSGKISGQVRICANPVIFLRPHLVKIFTFAADPAHSVKRLATQQKLRGILEEHFRKCPNAKTKAIQALFTPPQERLQCNNNSSGYSLSVWASKPVGTPKSHCGRAREKKRKRVRAIRELRKVVETKCKLEPRFTAGSGSAWRPVKRRRI